MCNTRDCYTGSQRFLPQFFFLNTSLPVCNLNRYPGPKGCRGTQVQSHCSPPAQRFSASSCFCFVPLGSCGTADPPAGKEKATQQCNLPDYVPHTHFVSWDQRHRSHLLLVWFLSWRPAEKQSPSGLYCKGPDLHGSTYRLMKAFGALCDILGSAKSLSCKPDRFLPAWRPLDCGPCLGTDTTFDNDIDCSIFEVIITGLVGGH